MKTSPDRRAEATGRAEHNGSHTTPITASAVGVVKGLRQSTGNLLRFAIALELAPKNSILETMKYALVIFH